MKKEIGSFIGLDLKEFGEYYWGNKNIARLNSGRAGIYHACKSYDCNAIYIPHYLCPTVKRFLLEHGIEVKSYFINDRFEPVNLQQEEGHAVLLVNYFGILSVSKIKMLADQFKNVIIDNAAAFFCDPIKGSYNIYSPRKFFGVPDGCYVIGADADKGTNDFKQDFSSMTASFLLKRVEFSLIDTYQERMNNEERIDNSGILRMSQLTLSLLNNIDYLNVKIKRRKNFSFAHELFRKINKIDPSLYINDECIPMIYPLVIEEMDLNDKLKENRIYTGRWWNYVLGEVRENTFEAWLSKYMVPVPIDQRYGSQELTYVHNIIV